jgi:LysM repeat protein
MDFEFLVVLNGRVQAYLWLRRAGRYFPYIEKRLAEEGLPDDLKYLAVAESDLKVAARSRAAAMGAWQFMDFTGRIYGLRKDEDFDERLHFQKSTEAAIKYLKKLKGMFGSWTLAMAAYNCGEGCIRKAIDEQEVGDYFRLDLPEETERYVYRIAAIKVLLENPGRYGYDIEPDQVYPELDVDRASVSLAQEIHITQAAKAIGTDYKVIKELNPEINGSHLPKGAYDILTPAGMGPKLEAFLKTAVPADAKAPAKAPGKDVPEFHVVRKGDTLNSISQRTGVPMDTIRQLNGIKANEIAVGQKLKLKP